MPTVRTVTVKSAGGDYTSLSGALTGEVGDLVSLDRQLDIACYSMADATAAAFSGWTTDATRYIRVYTPPTERHDGEMNTSKYRLTVVPAANAGVVSLNNNNINVVFEGIQILVVAVNDFSFRYGVQFNNGAVARFDSCIIRFDTSAGAGCRCGGITATPFQAQTVDIWNCAIMQSTAMAATIGIDEHGAGGDAFHVYNCTIRNFETGLKQSTGTVSATNCGITGATTPISGTVTQTTNSSTTPTFAAGKEFKLDTTDTTWKNQGTDLSGTFTTDIKGSTRIAPWDIGADEVAASAPFTVVGRSVLMYD